MIKLTNLKPLLQFTPQYVTWRYAKPKGKADLSFRDQATFSNFHAFCRANNIKSRRLINQKNTFENNRYDDNESFAKRLRISIDDFAKYINNETDVKITQQPNQFKMVANLLAIKRFVSDTIILYAKVDIAITKQTALIYQINQEPVSVLFIENNDLDINDDRPKLTFSIVDHNKTDLKQSIKIINCDALNYNNITEFQNIGNQLTKDVNRIVEIVQSKPTPLITNQES